MKGFAALVRKHFGESRWMLGLSMLALFGLGWLIAYNVGRTFADPERLERFRRMAGRQLGEELTIGRMEANFWTFPFVVLPVLIWAIARGSIAVGGELERGTLDMVLSRPISRTAYLGSHILVAILGLIAIVGALAGGFLLGNSLHKVPDPPGFARLIRPAANLAALGLAVYGYTLLPSSADVVRWRATMVGSVATLLGLISREIARLESLANLRKYLEGASIFSRYNPVDAIGKAATLAFDVEVLAAVGAVGILLALLIFNRRDLPASG